MRLCQDDRISFVIVVIFLELNVLLIFIFDEVNGVLPACVCDVRLRKMNTAQPPTRLLLQDISNGESHFRLSSIFLCFRIVHFSKSTTINRHENFFNTLILQERKSWSSYFETIWTNQMLYTCCTCYICLLNKSLRLHDVFPLRESLWSCDILVLPYSEWQLESMPQTVFSTETAAGRTQCKPSRFCTFLVLNISWAVIILWCV